jgi:hypothetical protein
LALELVAWPAGDVEAAAFGYLVAMAPAGVASAIAVAEVLALDLVEPTGIVERRLDRPAEVSSLDFHTIAETSARILKERRLHVTRMIAMMMGLALLRGGCGRLPSQPRAFGPLATRTRLS